MKLTVKTIILLSVLAGVSICILCFMGCTMPSEEQQNPVQVTTYNITTQWSTGCHCDNTYEEFIKPGFYQKVPLWEGPIYNITGTIQNKATYEISQVTIIINLYDEENQYLCNTSDLNRTITIHNLSVKQKKNFSVELFPNDCAIYLQKDISELEVYDFFQSFRTIDFKLNYKKM